MVRTLALALIFCLSALAAAAGPWPREQGGYFVSTDMRLSWPQDRITGRPTGTYYTGYVEYGLTARLTLGLDLGRSVSGDGKVVVFARLPLLRGTRAVKLAAELGLGQIDGASVLRPGMSVGRGVSGFGLSGWVTADSVAEVSLSTGKADYKFDLTLGLNLEDGRKAMLQVQTGAPQADLPFARLAPSLVIPIGTRRHLEVGGSYGLTGDTSVGIKLGLWQTF